jgi:hypothetical protein
MTDRSQFQDTRARAAPARNGGFLIGLILGLVLGAGVMALWEIYRPALKPSQADVGASAPNETAQAIKDLQATQQNIVGQLEQKIAGQLESLQQTLASEKAETNRLSHEVMVLGGKLDALQQSFASALQQPSPAASSSSLAPAKRRR